jgi:hypothetical protein
MHVQSVKANIVYMNLACHIIYFSDLHNHSKRTFATILF